MSIYDFTVEDNAGNPVDFSQFKGKVLLIVNTASKCGFTPQYKGLEELYEKYKDSGLVVIGFPCDQFANQEPGNDEEIASFCSLTYGVSFPLMKKVKVNGPDTIPLFDYLKEQTKGVFGKKVKWNFTKFLVARNGDSIKRFSPITKPSAIEKYILEYLR